MQFQSVQILNYKSFRNSGPIPLNPGFNVIVGKNDSGKSAFLEALSLKAQSNPHRSLLTAPKPNSTLDPKSSIEFIIDIDYQELTDILTPYKQIAIPCSPSERTYDASIRYVNKFKNAVDSISNSKGELICRAANQLFQGYLKHGGRFEEGDAWVHLNVNHLPNDLQFDFINGMTGSRNNTQSFAQICCDYFSNLIYIFRAERLNIGQCGVGDKRILQANAANLAEVLNLLMSSNPKRFDKFLKHIRAIFPHITQITVPIVGGHTAMIKIWNIPGESEREDLAVPLSESGTGIGQVLAMLYVVVTADVPKVIIIDEPQSFLHPGAVRKLIEILHAYPQHQYIITTHTPTAISATGAESLIQIRRNGYESVVDVISAKSTRDLKFFLADIGASLGDVFGSDKVLWVEGPTEENCFPLILRKLSKTLLSGTQILAVKNTGDLEGKLASRIFDVYNKLTSSSTLLPPAIAFLLDTEGKSKSEKDEIDRKSSGLVRWLPRRMYENYLLSPSHLANILTEDDGEREETIGVQEIEEWLLDHFNDKKYFDKDKYGPNLEYPSDTWEKTVHAAKLLNDLFNELTEARVEYRKVDHGLRLTELLIEEPTPAIQELSQFLKSILEEKPDGNL
jgi:predicted ATPase